MHLLHGKVDYAVLWHRRAAQACGALGEAADAAFPALTEAMNDQQAASDVGIGLSRMMPKSVPVLSNILATGNVVARCRAADSLMTAFSHPKVEPMARTALLNALHDPDHGPRAQAASALQIWKPRPDVLEALTAALKDPYPGVRGNAATSLGNFGSAAKAAVPELIKLLQDTNSYISGTTVGDRARAMLLKIDPEAAAGAGVNK